MAGSQKGDIPPVAIITYSIKMSRQKAIKFPDELWADIQSVKKEYAFNSDADTIRFLVSLGAKEIESGGQYRIRLERIEGILINNRMM